MAAPFIHLHVHSAFSLAEGAIHTGKLKELCLENDMPAVAVADSNNLFAALELSETLNGAGIQPVTGIQLSVRIRDDEGLADHLPALVLLAQDEAGYANLMKLSSRGFLAAPERGAVFVDLDELAAFSDGLICLTGGLGGPVDQLFADGSEAAASALLVRLSGIFTDRLYVQIERTTRGADRLRAPHENSLLKAAYDLQLPLVAAQPVYFPAAADHEAHDALLCIAEGAYVHQDDRRKVSPECWFKSGDAMRALYEDLPEAVENTALIARRCAFRPRTHAPILPAFAGEGGSAEAAELERQARDGLAARLAALDELAAPRETYEKRLETELQIINRMGFPGYFLIVADFIKWAKENDVPVGPGRGSGAGSLVAWSLTVTNLDPLRFNLLFERFLNPERVSMPDFDVDFCQDRRDRVIQYVQEKYGKDRVAQIITFGKLQARAVLRDVGRVLNMPFPQVDRICKLVPNNPANPVTLAEAIAGEPKLREERDGDERVAALLQKALKLEGLYRHASTHAAGVVIGDRPLDELVPLYLDPRSDMPATQFNMKWVEPAGLVKFDFLGLKTLTVIKKAMELCVAKGVEIDIDRIPLDDRETYDMLGEGNAVGVFQLESSGMRSTLRGLKPDSLEDIIALVSLYRPGPMENIPTYIERKFGREDPDYLHPLLEDVLKETYGVIIYQEQVMQIAQILSGYSLGEADLLRRAMGKKKKEEMDKQKIRFVEGADRNNVDRGRAESIFELVAKFAGYGFNKSHAAAYALIAYQTGWLKANHKAEFLAASMSLDMANTDKLAIFMKDARENSVEVLPPDVNRSKADFTVCDGAVIYALSAIKNVGGQAMAHIADVRSKGGPYKDIYDFAERVDGRMIGKRGIENLARAGAFDSLHPNRAQLFANADFLIRYSVQAAEERDSSQGGLFGADDGAVLERPKLKSADDWPPLERLDNERGAIGFYFTGHPLDDYAAALDKLNVTLWQDVRLKAEGTRISLSMAGVVRAFNPRRSKTGKPFAWVELSDPTGEFEVTVFSEILEAGRDLLQPGQLVIMPVTAEDRDGEVRLTAEGVRLLDQAASSAAPAMKITLSSPAALPSLRKRLYESCAGAPKVSGRNPANRNAGGAGEGQASLILFLADRNCEVELALPGEIQPTVALKGAIKSIDGVADVTLL